jgi:hypothetical protein
MEAMHRPVGAGSGLVPSRKSVAYSEDRYSFRHGVSTKQGLWPPVYGIAVILDECHVRGIETSVVDGSLSRGVF